MNAPISDPNDPVESQLRRWRDSLHAGSRCDCPTADDLLRRRSLGHRRRLTAGTVLTATVIFFGWSAWRNPPSESTRPVRVTDAEALPATVDGAVAETPLRPDQAGEPLRLIRLGGDDSSSLVAVSDESTAGRYPVYWHVAGHEEAELVGFIKPPAVRSVPVWQLSPAEQSNVWSSGLTDNFHPYLEF